MSFMTLSSQEKPLYFRKNSFMTPFFTLFVLSRASDNTSSQNIGGYGCMGRPPPQIFWGTVTPVPPMSPPLGVAVYLGWCSAMHNTSMLKSPAQEQLLCIRN